MTNDFDTLESIAALKTDVRNCVTIILAHTNLLAPNASEEQARRLESIGHSAEAVLASVDKFVMALRWEWARLGLDPSGQPSVSSIKPESDNGTLTMKRRA